MGDEDEHEEARDWKQRRHTAQSPFQGKGKGVSSSGLTYAFPVAKNEEITSHPDWSGWEEKA